MQLIIQQEHIKKFIAGSLIHLYLVQGIKIGAQETFQQIYIFTFYTIIIRWDFLENTIQEIEKRKIGHPDFRLKAQVSRKIQQK